VPRGVGWGTAPDLLAICLPTTPRTRYIESLQFCQNYAQMEAFLSSILPEMSLFLSARRILSNKRKIPGKSNMFPKYAA
ncbi:MAG TPA: hypothetical protein DCK85_11740, partial [Ktedonobacter sp.]|nr:hypothetical protein [Ktedonobacter sp.]